jgi:decaprenylphospho-beta-D-erythro-pentofuranosid-2-ulose 2-reductase
VIDATGMPQTAVVIGGGSQIARDTMMLLADRRLSAVVLASREDAGLQATATELRARGVERVLTSSLDVTETDRLDAFAERAVSELGSVDLVLMAVGAFGTSDLDALDAKNVCRVAATNFSGPAAALAAFVAILRAQGTGRIVVLSSVAGVRVRKANFVYGAAKAGIDGLALGLGDALEGSGVGVTVVRPGFVRTRMTAGLKATPFAVESQVVAEAIVRGLETGAPVVWVPPVLRLVSALMRLLPRGLWRRIPGWPTVCGGQRSATRGWPY